MSRQLAGRNPGGGGVADSGTPAAECSPNQEDKHNRQIGVWGAQERVWRRVGGQPDLVYELLRIK